MGLDLVELVCRLEEELEITIPDEAAVKMTTPGEVIDYLASVPQIKENCARKYIALIVWLILEDEAGIKRKDYNEDSRFIEDMGMD